MKLWRRRPLARLRVLTTLRVLWAVALLSVSSVSIPPAAADGWVGFVDTADFPIDVQSCFFITPVTMPEWGEMTELAAYVDLDGAIGAGEIVSLLLFSDALEVLVDAQVEVYPGAAGWVYGSVSNYQVAPGDYWLGAYGRDSSGVDNVRLYGLDRGTYGSRTQDAYCGQAGGWDTPPSVTTENEGVEGGVGFSYVSISDPGGGGGGGDPMVLFPLLFSVSIFVAVVAGLAVGWSMG